MIEGNKEEHITEDEQASKQIPSEEYETELNEEALVEVSGGGLGNMVTGFRSAGAYGGSLGDKLASARYGLTSSSSTATKSFANAQVQKSFSQSGRSGTK